MEADLQGGFYSNRDSAYIYAHLAREFGPVVVLERQAAEVPAHLRASRGACPGRQLRFWSLCTRRVAGHRPHARTASPTARC